MANCKPITCYGKEYKSCKSLSADFGFNDNQYWKFVSQLRKGLKPETIVEDILDDINIKNAKTIEHNNVKEEQKVTISGDLKGTVVNKIFKDREELKHEVIQEVVEDEIEEHHNDTTIMVSPEYYTAKSPTELLELIDNFNPSKINIIDFENVVGRIDSEEINKEDTVNIFVYNATIYSNNFFKTIVGIKVPNIQILTHTVGDQLVDHLITYYLGVLHTKYPEKKYSIISRDTGFSAFINMMNNTKSIDLKEPTQKVVFKKKNEPTPDEKFRYCLFDYISRNNVLNVRATISRKEFKPVFEPFYAKKDKVLDNKEVDHLIDKLIGYGVLEFVPRNNIHYYRFDMFKILEYIK